MQEPIDSEAMHKELFYDSNSNLTSNVHYAYDCHGRITRIDSLSPNRLMAQRLAFMPLQ